ncbi:unnamed protein product, partial [Mycena citricolor]
PYLVLLPPEDKIPDLDKLPFEQPPTPPPTTPACTLMGHCITLAANPPYFNGNKSKYMGSVDLCTTYIGAYQSEFSQDKTKILFILSYLRNKAGTSCAASRWVMNWKQRNFKGPKGIKAGVTSMTFMEELQRAFGDTTQNKLLLLNLWLCTRANNPSSKIASRLYNTGIPLPKAYGAFKDWCINIEPNALRDQLCKVSYGHSTP